MAVNLTGGNKVNLNSVVDVLDGGCDDSLGGGDGVDVGSSSGAV